MTLPARARWVHGAPLAVAVAGTGLIVQSACKATPPSGSPAGQRAARGRHRATPFVRHRHSGAAVRRDRARRDHPVVRRAGVRVGRSTAHADERDDERCLHQAAAGKLLRPPASAGAEKDGDPRGAGRQPAGVAPGGLGIPCRASEGHRERTCWRRCQSSAVGPRAHGTPVAPACGTGAGTGSNKVASVHFGGPAQRSVRARSDSGAGGGAEGMALIRPIVPFGLIDILNTFFHLWFSR
jgi:hypothetical protein